MSMPIQRQSEAYGIFDDGPRFARDRSSTDLPSGLAGLVNSMGPRIQAGLLNTRQAAGPCHAPYRNNDFLPVHCSLPGGHSGNHMNIDKLFQWTVNDNDEDVKVPTFRTRRSNLLNTRQAVNTDGMDPNSHAYGRQPYDPLFGEFGHDGYDYEGVSRREFNHRMRDRDIEQESQDAREQEDDESGYNWGPEPPEHLGSRHPFDRAAARRLAAPTDYSLARPGPLVDTPLFEQDPDDYTRRRPYSGAHCPICGRPDRAVSSPGCREFHAAKYTPQPWEQTEDGWQHPGSGSKIVPGDDGQYVMLLPAVSRKPGQESWANGGTHEDPQVLMDHHDWMQGGPTPSWHDNPKWWHRTFPPHLPGHTAAAEAPVMDPAQVPQGGGYQIGHQVGLQWRPGSNIRGTVIGVNGPDVHVRWADGQYSTEEPRNIQLL